MPRSFDVRPSQRSNRSSTAALERRFRSSRNESQVYPLYFLYLTDIPAQRTLLNPFGINSLRILFIATEGVLPRRTPNLVTRHSSPHSSFFLSNSCTLFCTHQELNSFIFKRFRTLCQKPPGVGGGDILLTSHPSPRRAQLSTDHSPLISGRFLLSLLECADPKITHITPLECAVPKTRHLKSFRMRSSGKSGGA